MANLADAQREHINTIFHENTRSVVEMHANEQEILCATTIKEILGAESTRLAVEGDLPRHMMQYIEFDALVNSPDNDEADVLPKNI